VVMITEENTSRPKWQIARVLEGIRGKDGLVRTFRLKTAKGVVLRPIQRLHLLEPDESDVERDATETEVEDLERANGDEGGDSTDFGPQQRPLPHRRRDAVSAWNADDGPYPTTIENEPSKEELVDNQVDQGGVDIPTPMELRQPTTITRSGRKSYKPDRY